jgi:hypothetical protein
MKKIFIVSFIALLFLSVCTVIAQDTKTPVVIGTYSAVIPIGEKFDYRIEVNGEPNVTFEFQLLRGPEGMTIDSKTGVVTWTPKAVGEVTAEILTSYFTSPTTKMKAVGTVLKLIVVDFKGVISGTVKDEAGEEITNAVVTLYKNTATDNKVSNLYVNSTMTDASGKYNLTVYQEGSYLIQVSYKNEIINSWSPEPTYLSVWYKDAASAEKAEMIPISKTSLNFTADITMHINPNQSILTFTYNETIVKNQEFKYQVTLPIKINTQSLEYRLMMTSTGTSLDANTGILKWTPSEKGEFGVEIGVFLKNSTTQIAKVVLKVKVVDFLGTLSGIVENETGEPLSQILVTLYKKITIAEKGKSYITSLSDATDDKGAYTITKIEPGTYYAQARPGEDKTMSPLPNPNLIYMPVWYKDSPTMDYADVIVIAQTLIKVDANFTMHKIVKVEPKVYSISGRVTDASSSKGFANATVFVSIASNTNGAEANGIALGMPVLTCSDPAFGVFTDVVYKTITDIEGNYKLSVKEGASYIVACFAENYLMQYYNGKASIAEAVKLTPEKDETGIDFNLTLAPQAKAKVSGKVQDESKIPVVAKIVLYSSPISSDTKPTTRSVSTNAIGEFVFEKVPNGKYYLQVYPVKDYMPAYYKINSCGIREPKDADIVNVVNDADLPGLEVCVEKISTTGGGKISGMIVEPNGNGICGVIVTAESKDQTDVAYAISENDGSFEITGLGVGDYTLTGEKFGYSTIVKDGSTIDYAKNAFNSSVNLIMSQNFVTAIEDKQIIPSDYNLYQNYPNPFNPSTTIIFSLPQNDRVTLKVFDVLGNEIKQLTDGNLNAGIHEVKFNAQGLPSGFYIYRLTTLNFSSSKKMLLLK